MTKNVSHYYSGPEKIPFESERKNKLKYIFVRSFTPWIVYFVVRMLVTGSLGLREIELLLLG